MTLDLDKTRATTLAEELFELKRHREVDYDTHDRRKVLTASFWALKEYEEMVIRYYFGIGHNATFEPWTMPQIALEFRCTKDRIERIRNRALKKLRKLDAIQLLWKYNNMSLFPKAPQAPRKRTQHVTGVRYRGAAVTVDSRKLSKIPLKAFKTI